MELIHHIPFFTGVNHHIEEKTVIDIFLLIAVIVALILGKKNKNP
jgi:hypothetical protein